MKISDKSGEADYNWLDQKIVDGFGKFANYFGNGRSNLHTLSVQMDKAIVLNSDPGPANKKSKKSLTLIARRNKKIDSRNSRKIYKITVITTYLF